VKESVLWPILQEAREYATSNTEDGINFDVDKFHNKFAELIVEECAGVCISRAAGYHVNHLIPDEAIFCSIYIRRHFGLE
jgi:hypothetical protein